MTLTTLEIRRKTTNTYTLTFTNDGEIQDITGWTVFFTVKKNTNQTDSQALISKTITTHTSPTTGVTTISLSPTDTDISAGNYLYDITYIDDSNHRYCLGVENFVVLDYITQRSE
jgi:hypothetical protein